MLKQKQRSVMLHDFSMTPRADVPRSQFNLSHGRKVPFNFSFLTPIFCEFALPGDTWNTRVSCAARTATPIVPVQDNWHLHYFFFFIPMRLVWDNTAKFFGEQANPADSISYTIPVVQVANAQLTIGSLYDYFGIPTTPAITGTLTINTLPFRCYNLVWNEWFRDENLQNSVNVPKNDGPDPNTNYVLLRRGKRFDYITQALPWPQKGNTAVSIPLGTQAIVKTSASQLITGTGPVAATFRDVTSGGFPGVNLSLGAATGTGALSSTATAPGALGSTFYPSNLYADLTTATAATINALRTSITLQQYLERDARYGTRYTEYVWNNYSVRTADARLNRPEFIGGGYAPITTIPVPQTSGTGATGTTTPAGNLAATGYVGQGNAGFTYSATEHGYLLGLCAATVDLTYSQGLRRMWSMSTRYDVPVPILAGLGEQSLLNKEIYATGTATDDQVFGYVPRFDDYRFIPSQIVGIYRPAAASNIAYWHSSQLFGSLPTLNATFIQDDATTVVQRNFAAGASSSGQQLLADFFFDIKAARPLSMYGIPGLTRL